MAEDKTATPGAEEPRDRRSRPLLALLSLLPLALAAGVLVTAQPATSPEVTHGAATATPGPGTSVCPGALQLPDGALAAGGDEELAATPPSTQVTVGTVAVEPESSVLYGTISASETLQEDDGSVRTPSIRIEGTGGKVLADEPAAADLGVSVLGATGLEDAPQVTAATAEGGRAVADTVQSTSTSAGDYRSLALTRCAEPTTSARFLGVSTQRGDSAALVLENPSDRPATASVQLWTADGPATMDGRSQIVVAPGTQERVLLESIAPGQDVVGVDVAVLGAPLAMTMQATERDGLTPGGAELLSSLPDPSTEQVLPGVPVGTIAPVLVLGNPHGADTTATVQVSGPDGIVEGAGAEAVDVPAGGVVQVPLEGLTAGSYAVRVTSESPLTAVTRASLAGADLPGDTIGAPVDVAFVAPAPALQSHGLLALPAQGAAGELTLAATENTSVTVVPLAADGSAGELIALDLRAGTATVVPSDSLMIGEATAAGFSIVPDTPGAVHAGWTQRQSDGQDPVLVSSLPVLSSQGQARPVTVRSAG